MSLEGYSASVEKYMTDKEPNLLSCPLCGGMAITTHKPSVIDGAPAVECQQCGLCLSMLTATHDPVIRAWNTRTPSPALSEEADNVVVMKRDEVEKVKDILRYCSVAPFALHPQNRAQFRRARDGFSILEAALNNKKE